MHGEEHPGNARNLDRALKLLETRKDELLGWTADENVCEQSESR